MPKVPEAVPGRVSLPVAPSTGALLPLSTAGRPGEALGQGLGDASERLAASEAKIAEAQKYGQVLKMSAGATRELQDLTVQFENDTDFQTAPQRFRQQADAIREKYVGQTEDEGVKALFTQKFQDLSLPREFAVKQDARRKGVDATKASLLENVDALVEQAATAKSEIEQQHAMRQIGVSYDGAAIVGAISQVDATEGKKKALGKLDDSLARKQITANPEQAAQDLMDPNKYRNLDEVSRARLSDTAVRRADSVRAQRDREDEKRKKALSDQISKDGFEMWSRGQLTSQWVLANKDRLDQSDFKALLHAAVNDDAKKDDPGAVIDLTTRLASEDVSADAARYLKQGRIKTSTYQSIVGTNRSQLRDDQPASPYKSARDLVKQTLDPTQLLTGPAAQIGKVGMANALVEYDDWSRDNPNASRADAMNQARDVIRRYQVLNYEQQSLAVGLPRFYSGPREALKPQDLDLAERKANQEFEAGRIGKEALASEIQKIESWRYLLDQKTQAGASTTQKPGETKKPNPVKPGG